MLAPQMWDHARFSTYLNAFAFLTTSVCNAPVGAMMLCMTRFWMGRKLATRCGEGGYEAQGFATAASAVGPCICWLMTISISHTTQNPQFVSCNTNKLRSF